MRETMPYKNVIAIDLVEDLITRNWQGNDLVLNIDDCNIQELFWTIRYKKKKRFTVGETVAKRVTETQQSDDEER